MSGPQPSSSAYQPAISHNGSGGLYANLGAGKQRNHIQDGTNNHQINVDTITNYYATHQAETPPQPTHTIPFTRDDGFVERAELSQLQHLLSRSGRRVALYGLGGVGKSQLAIEYCYRLRDNSPETWVLWIHTSSAERFDQDMRKLADDVDIPGRDERGADIFQLVYSWLLKSKKRWLLVLDSADDMGFLYDAPSSSKQSSNSRPIRLRIEYLPPSENGAVLITTRKRAVALKLAGVENMLELKPNKEHAVALVEGSLKEISSGLMNENLALALDFIPLAIAQATAYIRKQHPRCTVDRYIAMLGGNDETSTELLSEESDGLRRDVREASNSVLTTWRISFEQIHRSSKTAAGLLSLMSFFNYQGIPESLLRIDSTTADRTRIKSVKRFLRDIMPRRLRKPHTPLATADIEQCSTVQNTHCKSGFNRDIDTLRDYSLISVTSYGSAFEMHRLVQLATQVWLQRRKEYSWWQRQSLKALDTAFPTPEHQYWHKCSALYSHAKVMQKVETYGREALQALSSILLKAAFFAWTQGLYTEAEAAARQSYSIRGNILGEANLETMYSLGMLALVLQQQGKYEAAEEMSRRALGGYEKVLGKEHPSTLTSVDNLASVLRYQGKYEAAEETSRRALGGYEKVLGKEHPSTLTSVGNLASVLQDQGKYEAAEEMSRRALEGYEKVLGKEHPSTLTSVGNLAQVLQGQGKYEAAEEMSRRALEGREKVLGKEHPSTLTSVGNLASVLQDQGKYEAAEEMSRRALEGYEKVLGKEHPCTLTSVGNLAQVLQGQGKYEAAEEMSRRALGGYEKVLGKEHPDTLTSVSNLALVLRRQGKYEAAEEMNRRALKGREKVLGPEHPLTLTTVRKLAALLSGSLQRVQSGQHP